MIRNGRWRGLRSLVVAGLILGAVPLNLGGCDLGEFTTTSTVTLSGREVIAYLIRSAILTPIQTAIDQGIDALFDRLEGEDDD